MIFRRLALVLAAAAVLATSASIAVVALAFALYALLRAYLTTAGAAAVVAGAAALLLAITAIIVSRQPRLRTAARSTTTGSLVERAIALVQEKPAVAIAAALGAGFMIIRNPRYFGAAIRAFVEGRENPASPL